MTLDPDRRWLAGSRRWRDADPNPLALSRCAQPDPHRRIPRWRDAHETRRDALARSELGAELARSELARSELARRRPALTR